MNFKIDFVTVVYDDEDTLNLLKVQAHSIKFVEPVFINNIYIIYNDSGEYNFDDIISFYPKEIREKVKVLYVDPDFDIHSYGWHTQQLIKILMAEKVTSKHYLALDAKDHFFKPVDHSVFFEEGKPKLFLGYPGKMIKKYYGALKLFRIEDPFELDTTWSGARMGEEFFMQSARPLATTPYLFTTKLTLDLIAHHGQSALGGFLKTRPPPFTEFYLTTAYLISSGEIKNYSLAKNIKRSLVFHQSTVLEDVDDDQCKILSIHKKIRSPESVKWTAYHKEKILGFYRSCYDEKIVKIINALLE